MATKLGTLTLDLIAKTGGFTEPMKNAGDTAERESKRIEKNVGSALDMIKGFGITALAGFTVGAVISMADEYSQMAAQIRNATNSQQEYDEVQKHLLETANTTYRSLKEAQQVYLDVGGALKAYGETTERSLRITDSLSFSYTHNATEADKAKNATDAYMKSIYSGKVSGDAWISILSAIPSIVNDLSKSLNKSEADILSMGNAGKLSTKELNNALDVSREKSEALANNMSNSLPDGLNNARNGFLVLAGTINETYGVTNTMAAGLGVVGDTAKLAADNLDVLGNVTMVAGAYLVGSYLPALALGTKSLATDTLAKVSNVMATRTKILADYEVAKSNLTATAAMVKSMGATNAQTAAMMTNARAAYQQATAAKASMFAGSGLIGVLGGPVGLGVTVATVAAGYLLMRDSTDESTKSLRENNESVNDAIKKYNELAVSKRNAQLVSEKDELKKLGDAYDDYSDKLVTAAYALSRNNDMTAEQSKLVNGLIAEYKKTGDIDAFSQKINGLNFISQTSKDRISTLGGSVKETGDQFRTQKSFVEQMAPAVKSVGDQAVKTATEVAGLSEEIKKLLSDNTAITQKNNLIGSIVNKAKVDPKLAEYIYEMRKTVGILGTGKSLTDEQVNSVRERWQSEKNLNKTIDERSRLEEKNKKLVEAQGNAMKVNAKVASLALKYNISAKESASGLPSGLIQAMIMRESGGDTYRNGKLLTSPAGAQGIGQFIPGTAKQYKVDVRSEESSIKGMVAYMKDLLKKYDGNIDKAIMAYNAGPSNVDSGKANGFRETRNYLKDVKGYMGGSSGILFNEDYSYEDYIKEVDKISIEREKFEKEQASKQLGYASAVATEKVRISTKLAQDVKGIHESGFSDVERDRLVAEYQRRADIDIQIAEATQSDKLASYSDYMKSEEQLINQNYARRQRDLKLDIELTADQYTEASLNLEKQRVQELQRARWHALEIQQSMHDAILGLSANADDIFAKATMTPQEYSQWSLENERSNAQVGLKNQRVGVERDIMTSEAYSTDDERYEALQKAHQEYRDGLAAIDVEYYQKQADLQNQTQAASMAGYGAMFGMMGSMLDAYGEKESAGYRVAFAMQRAFVLSSAMLNAKGAVMAAWNDPSNTTIWSKMAAAAATVVQTNELMSAIQGVALSGMAHDGIDSVPKEGTWLLDKGERVVDSRTNADLKSYLANSGGSKAPKIIINTLPGQTANVSTASDGTVTIDMVEQYLVNSLQQPNSKVRKALAQNTTAAARR